jgi:signal transduction histidine kinase
MYTRETKTMDETNAHGEPANVTQHPQNPPALNAEWLASLSHELRGPLTAIQGYASMLLRHQDRISSEERQEFLQAISKGSGRMASVLDRFLDIANLEAGTIQLHPQPVDMKQLVRDVLLATQQEYPDKNLSLTFKQESNPTSPLDPHGFVINADILLIRKMFTQLLDNAQKYSNARTPIEVTLSCTSLSERYMQIPSRIRAQLPGGEDQRLVELSIRDHGIGIPIADHERIFERFERVDMQLTREVTGLGLGLTMCKYIVSLHHGAIWVESTPGEGSTFHVLFPAAEKEPAPSLNNL